jgi:hypothetical protein
VQLAKKEDRPSVRNNPAAISATGAQAGNFALARHEPIVQRLTSMRLENGNIPGRNPCAEPLSADEIRRESEYWKALNDWEGLTETQIQQADPSLRKTRWPHKQAHDIAESLEGIDIQDET